MVQRARMGQCISEARNRENQPETKETDIKITYSRYGIETGNVISQFHNLILLITTKTNGKEFKTLLML